MAAPTIRLLGRPRVEWADGTIAAPRGRKAWGLLAYCLLRATPPSREELAGLLFADADDPRGALRWNLAELRRLLGPEARIGGDPVLIELGPDAVVDVRALGGGSRVGVLTQPGLGGELLEGLDLPDSPAFETWLLAERRRSSGRVAALLREAAIARLAEPDGPAAIDLAERLVVLDPLDEDAQAILVRAYVAAGEGDRARRQLAAATHLLRRELGIEPSPALARAADRPPVPSSPATSVGGRAAASAALQAGEAAIAAGAVEAGLEGLRMAIDQARAAGERDLEAGALIALGEALVHAVRGCDGDGSTALHAGLAVAEAGGDRDLAARAERELGYVELLRARYERSSAWLERAEAHATDPMQRAWILAEQGVVATDTGRTGHSVALLEEASQTADAAGSPRAAAWSLAFLGRAHLLRGELGQARRALERSAALSRSLGWISLTPWPEALLGHVSLAEGRTEEARELLDGAFALGCQLGDPCWEGTAACGIGLILAAEGDGKGALRWLADAATRCVRLPDAYLWIRAFCLDALCGVAVAEEHREARRWIADLEALAAQGGMQEMLVRAQLHLGDLGVRRARVAVRLFAVGVDNPTLKLPIGDAAR